MCVLVNSSLIVHFSRKSILLSLRHYSYIFCLCLPFHFEDLSYFSNTYRLLTSFMNCANLCLQCMLGQLLAFYLGVSSVSRYSKLGYITYVL